MTLVRREPSDGLTSLQKQALKLIKQSGSRGMTNDEILNALGFENLATTRVRCEELAALGLVKFDGRDRSTIKGKVEPVWVVTPQGKTATA